MFAELAVAAVLAQAGGGTDDITVSAAPDGRFVVTERVSTRATHRLPSRVPVTDERDRLYSVSDVRVSGAAHADDDTVTFTGPAILTYTVDGAVAEDGQVRLQLTGGWDQDLDRVTVNFTASGVSTADCFAGAVGSARQCTFSEIGDRGVVHAEQDGLTHGDRMDLAVQLPAGALPANARFVSSSPLIEAFAFGPAAAVAFGTVLLLVLAGAAVTAWLRRRDRSAGPPAAAPAYVAYVARGELDLAGTVLDLVDRGHLRFTEEWQITHGDGEALDPFEQAVKATFRPGPLAVVDPDLPRLRALLDGEAHRRGWLSRRPERLRRAGFGLAGLGVLATVVLALTIGNALVGFAVLVAGLALTLVRIPARTARGRALGTPREPAETALAVVLDGVLATSRRRHAVASV
ncbi:DUF2207 domain-containing protein [Amycolatopsis jiangsuensis]|uniref:Uncharacterized protein n=1 Tax=Amycolatopsis jiangsuensis TaxID=1181879 RepID=A0A840IVW0_9PSEU|nr:DUF2207 domain-containing protein [Amycolatopsis jiangsuensis]MBB4686000.1 hypothetical protein [Amycolatopsis jiangsuensis]